MNGPVPNRLKAELQRSPRGRLTRVHFPGIIDGAFRERASVGVPPLGGVFWGRPSPTLFLRRGLNSRENESSSQSPRRRQTRVDFPRAIGGNLSEARVCWSSAFRRCILAQA